MPSGTAYLDATLPVEARIDDLLSRMTDDEKIGQLSLIENGSVDPPGVQRALLGGVLSGGDGNPPRNDPDGWFEMVEAYQQAALRTRLAIPILYGVDAIHGQSHVVGATIFPHAIGLGATRDAALVERIGRATAIETAATGIRWTYGPVVAVPQDVRWGRTYEAFSEDRALVEDLTAALVGGLQGGDLAADDAIAATAKHFIGDGGTAWGTSTYEDYRIDRGVTPGDEVALNAMYLGPYRSAIDAGARVVMASYSSTTAGKVHGDRHLLTDVLKGELAFSGFVVSDWGGVDEVVPGDYDASVAEALGAGIDMVMVPYDAAAFQSAVRNGLASGAIRRDRLDDAVRRILRVKFEMGLFERPMPSLDRSVVGSADHRALAAGAVAASAVLLQTAPGTLPVGAGTEPVLLAGAAADDLGTQLGGWSITWQGGTGRTTTGTTLRDALSAELGGRLSFEAGGGFEAGTHARVGIVVVAEPPYAEGRGDSETLELPAADLDIVDRVRPLVDRLVVVVYSGRPMMLDRLVAADAVVAAWLPGTEASGLADVLLGAKPFSGTTPYTWPRMPDGAPRTGRGACDGAVLPLGYGLTAAGDPLGPAPCPID
ncbi:MAG TPA: glycoside hydrolase family 3 protein [Candidatus Limnocylindrales bacterium]|nr:glycoside hydrolase family 3 protein [Candidatus Limnocylindrales bacterium]